jgi:lipopolysaccharide export system permease protein
MKKIDRLIIGSFIPPFIATFFISLMVLLLQFVWKYIDDIAGKNLPISIIGKLLFYTSASLVPLALPLACLLASIMTMGALGEHFELVAFKASGVSLFRYIRAIVVSGLIISIFAFLFANYLIPIANLKAGALLFDIRSSRPALTIKEGVFYTGIDGYSIRIGQKDRNNVGIHNIMIYDHTSGHGADNVITAKDGEMVMTEDKRYLVVKLLNGHLYQELPPKTAHQDAEHLRTNFVQYKKFFDLSSFALERTNENLFKNDYQMMNLKQLSKTIDTLYIDKKEAMLHLEQSLKHFYGNGFLPDSARQQVTLKNMPHHFLATQPKKFYNTLNNTALGQAREAQTYISNVVHDEQIMNLNIARHESEWHRKFTFSLACLLLIMIGAPLGAIIRKGGLGMPLVMAVVFFVVFHVLNMVGLKLAEGLLLSVWLGIWMPLLVMTPIAALLIRTAKNDATVFRAEWYSQLYYKVINRFLKN